MGWVFWLHRQPSVQSAESANERGCHAGECGVAANVKGAQRILKSVKSLCGTQVYPYLRPQSLADEQP